VDVPTFAALHDYVDANDYLAPMADEYPADPDEDISTPEVYSPVLDRLDADIRNGRVRALALAVGAADRTPCNDYAPDAGPCPRCGWSEPAHDAVRAFLADWNAAGRPGGAL
jgi:hypothetical protein